MASKVSAISEGLFVPLSLGLLLNPMSQASTRPLASAELNLR